MSTDVKQRCTSQLNTATRRRGSKHVFTDILI